MSEAHNETAKKERSPKVWVSLAETERRLGIPREEIKAYAENSLIPFHKSGKRYTFNWKLVACYISKMDIENMNRVKRAIKATPMSRSKVTGEINNKPRRTANVRAQG